MNNRNDKEYTKDMKQKENTLNTNKTHKNLNKYSKNLT